MKEENAQTNERIKRRDMNAREKNKNYTKRSSTEALRFLTVHFLL